VTTSSTEPRATFSVSTCHVTVIPSFSRVSTALSGFLFWSSLAISVPAILMVSVPQTEKQLSVLLGWSAIY